MELVKTTLKVELIQNIVVNFKLDLLDKNSYNCI